MTILLLPLNTGILLANSKIFNNNNQNGIVEIVMDLHCGSSVGNPRQMMSDSSVNARIFGIGASPAETGDSNLSHFIDNQRSTTVTLMCVLMNR